MSKKKSEAIDLDQMLADMVKKKLYEKKTSSSTGLMSILQFVDELSLDFGVFPYAKLILKLFYANTPGNESIKITDDDLQLIETIDNYGTGNPWLLAKAKKVQSGEITKPFQYLVMAMGRRSGKAQSLDSKVLTPSGWVRMGDIKVGDMVMSQDGKATKVNAVYPQGFKDIYRVDFSDGVSTECCIEHLWAVKSHADRQSNNPYRVLSLEEISKSLKVGKGINNYSVPLVEPIDFKVNEDPLSISPYVLGILLSDKLDSDCLDPEMLSAIDKGISANYSLNDSGLCLDIHLENKESKWELIKFLRLTNLWNCNSSDKFVPEHYKFSPINDRLELLQGLLDSDGEATEDGVISFATLSKRLVEDVVFLVQSLGGLATIRELEDKGKAHYKALLQLPANISPFRVKSKAEKVAREADLCRYIEGVEFVGKKQAQCISVDHPSRLYVVNDFIVTHNTFLSSVMTAYEVYKLITMITCSKCKDIKPVKSGEPCPDCGTKCLNHPQAYLGVRGAEPLRIFVAATSLTQAKNTGLKMHKERAMESPLLEAKYTPEEETVFYRTEYDEQRYKRQKDMGMQNVQGKGSIEVAAIHSNSAALHGTATILAYFDEFALFNTDGKDNDTKLLEAILAQTTTYRALRPEAGRVMMTSMPNKKEGKFWTHFDQGRLPQADNFLVVQAPTWEWRNDMTREFLESDMIYEEDAEGLSFDKLFGAQFVDEGADVYLPESAVEFAFSNPENASKKSGPENGMIKYYMHIDCAFKTCNYAYCIVHYDYRFNPKTNQYENFYIQDDSFFWIPSKRNPEHFIDSETGKEYTINEILHYIADVARRFRVTSFSYDGMQSTESISFFRKRGLPVRLLSFNGNKAREIYDNLRTIMLDGRVIACQSDLQLKVELQNLRVKRTARGPNIVANHAGVVKTKDVADCFAGACFLSTERTSRKSLPSRLMSLPMGGQFPSISGNSAGNRGGAGQSIFQRMNNLNSYNGGA